jgi:hypothetical protein
MDPSEVWALWAAVRDRAPLVQCITNLVRCGGLGCCRGSAVCGVQLSRDQPVEHPV